MGQIRTFIALIRYLLRLDQQARFELKNWSSRIFEDPAPHFVKLGVLTAGEEVGAWVETGTYKGATTQYLGSGNSKVYSIEPSTNLANRAKELFKDNKNILIINDSSENCLRSVVAQILDDGITTINFWLDGHYSGSDTYRSPVATPIVKELEIISDFMDNFFSVKIFIDDFRLFVNQSTDYPTTSFLTNWADIHNATWTVQHDILTIRKSR